MKNYNPYWLLFFSFACSLGNAQIEFEDTVIVNNHKYGSQGYGSCAADIDGDEDLDLVTFYYEGNLVWYENVPEEGGLIKPKVIHENRNSGTNPIAIDIDNDNDMDIFASLTEGQIFWYENIDGKGNFENMNVVNENANNEVTSLDFYDLDGDGDLDLVASFNSFDYEYKTVWYENLDGKGDFDVEKNITTIGEAGFSFAEDMDLDGDGDIIIGNRFWLENIDGKGTFTNEHTITTDYRFSNNAFPVDLDRDGDIDIVVAEGYYDSLSWYENIDGFGTFGPLERIASISGDVNYVYADDIDGDDDIDILIDGLGLYYLENDGEENFAVEKNIYGIYSSSDGRIIAADIDGDGDKDVISSCIINQKPGIAYSEFDQPTGAFEVEYILSEYFSNPIQGLPSDIDNDGDLDILVASSGDSRISWLEDVNGNQNFAKRHIISNTVHTPQYILVKDIDNDGDEDVFSISAAENKIAWFQNQGNGVFGEEIIVTTDVESPQMIAISDIDNDGYLDVLSASKSDSKLAWYKNLDGLGNFGEQQIISLESRGPISIYTADFDNDGNTDVLAKSINDDNISWYKNLDGLGNFGTKQVISFLVFGTNPYFDIADIDNDGDLDILTASDDDSDIAWYENIGEERQFSYSKMISSSSTNYASLADIDNDGDLDVVYEYGPNNAIRWVENIDGKGTFESSGGTVSDEPGDSSITNFITNFFVKDMDFDGDIDVVSLKNKEDKLIYTENLKLNTLSVVNYNSDDFSVYPIPSNNFITIKSSAPINEITIYNIAGRELKKVKLKEFKEEYQINIAMLSQGIYFAEMKSSGKKTSIKFLKK